MYIHNLQQFFNVTKMHSELKVQTNNKNNYVYLHAIYSNQIGTKEINEN